LRSVGAVSGLVLRRPILLSSRFDVPEQDLDLGPRCLQSLACSVLVHRVPPENSFE